MEKIPGPNGPIEGVYNDLRGRKKTPPPEEAEPSKKKQVDEKIKKMALKKMSKKKAIISQANKMDENSHFDQYISPHHEKKKPT